MTAADRAALTALIETLRAKSMAAGQFSVESGGTYDGGKADAYLEAAELVEDFGVGLLGRGDARRPATLEEENEANPLSRLPVTIYNKGKDRLSSSGQAGVISLGLVFGLALAHLIVSSSAAYTQTWFARYYRSPQSSQSWTEPMLILEPALNEASNFRLLAWDLQYERNVLLTIGGKIGWLGSRFENNIGKTFSEEIIKRQLPDISRKLDIRSWQMPSVSKRESNIGRNSAIALLLLPFNFSIFNEEPRSLLNARMFQLVTHDSVLPPSNLVLLARHLILKRHEFALAVHDVRLSNQYDPLQQRKRDCSERYASDPLPIRRLLLFLTLFFSGLAIGLRSGFYFNDKRPVIGAALLGCGWLTSASAFIVLFTRPWLRLGCF